MWFARTLLFVISAAVRGSLVVGFAQFKIALGMIAHRANLGSLGADHNMAAVAAFPHLDLALFKHL